MDKERETKPADAPEKKPASPPETKGKEGDNGPPSPDFDAAAKIMRDEINTITTRSSKLNGDKNAGWKRVQDDCHVHKAAAKDALKISNMTPELQSEYLRSFFGLMKPLGIGIRRDLVDLAEGVDGLTIPVLDAPVSELEGE